MSSLDSTTSDESSIPTPHNYYGSVSSLISGRENLKDHYGSISSLASSTSLISPQVKCHCWLLKLLVLIKMLNIVLYLLTLSWKLLGVTRFDRRSKSISWRKRYSISWNNGHSFTPRIHCGINWNNSGWWRRLRKQGYNGKAIGKHFNYQIHSHMNFISN